MPPCPKALAPEHVELLGAWALLSCSTNMGVAPMETDDGFTPAQPFYIEPLTVVGNRQSFRRFDPDSADYVRARLSNKTTLTRVRHLTHRRFHPTTYRADLREHDQGVHWRLHPGIHDPRTHPGEVGVRPLGAEGQGKLEWRWVRAHTFIGPHTVDSHTRFTGDEQPPRNLREALAGLPRPAQ